MLGIMHDTRNVLPVWVAALIHEPVTARCRHAIGLPPAALVSWSVDAARGRLEDGWMWFTAACGVLLSVGGRPAWSTSEPNRNYRGYGSLMEAERFAKP